MAFYSVVKVIDKDVLCCVRPSTDITHHNWFLGTERNCVTKFINIQTMGTVTKLSER